MDTAPHFYYVAHFQSALEWIQMRHSDLLRPQERDFILAFAALPLASRALMVRLVMRRGPWFRSGKLQYPEIPQLEKAARPLLDLGWLLSDHPMSLTELAAIHTKIELMAIFPNHGLRRDMRKPVMLSVLQGCGELPRGYRQWHAVSSEQVWRVMTGPLCDRLRLLFFGNLHQEWKEFVLADLGIFRYEAVPFEKSSRVFQSPAEIDLYVHLHACRTALDEACDLHAGDSTAVSGEAPALRPARILRQVEDAGLAVPNPWLQARRDKLLWKIGQACERMADWDTAQRAYALSAYPGARYRLMRVHERRGRPEDALALARVAQQVPQDEEESQKVARMLARLNRKLGHPKAPADTETTVQTRQRLCDVEHLELDLPQEGVRVEHAVRDHWQCPEAPVYYVENTLLNALFGLLCWPAIFAPIQGAFFHPFQSGPSDLNAPDFAARRRDLFSHCLAHLDEGTHRQVILQRYADKLETQCSFVHWGALSDALLQLALQCIPAAHLKLVFRRMLKGGPGSRTGLPDLIRFWPARSQHGISPDLGGQSDPAPSGEPPEVALAYELVEVKGPGDRLQDHQTRWLQFCKSHGIPVRVCHVRWRAPFGDDSAAGRAS